jgi:hypothetical protein
METVLRIGSYGIIVFDDSCLFGLEKARDRTVFTGMSKENNNERPGNENSTTTGYADSWLTNVVEQ